MSTLLTVVTGVLVAVGLTFLIISVLLFFFNTDAQTKRQLYRQAKEDYRQARGTAHRQLLEKVASALRQQIIECQKQIQAAKSDKQKIIESQNAELEKAYVSWLVEFRLKDISGIGDSLQWQIRHYVFKGKLSDLRLAYKIHGIGDQRQRAINAWVNYYEKRLSELSKKGFPGSSDIKEKYRSQIAHQESRIEEVERKIRVLEERLQPVNQELKWLRQVTSETFIQAYKNPEDERPEINRYLQGVFPEWEPMPDWFRAEVTAEVN